MFANGSIYQVTHGFEFHTASHSARRPWLFDAAFVDIIEIPKGVRRVAEDPEVVTAYLKENLDVGLVDPWDVKRCDKLC